MATVSDITITPLSGLNHIDALLDTGPDWNYKTGGAANTIVYTFSVTSGNETGDTSIQGGVYALNATQQASARSAFAYISSLTGIVFKETAIGSDADVHVCYTDIVSYYTTGLCSWSYSYTHIGDELNSWSGEAWVYLDNVQFGSENKNLAAGGEGYETLLHELGHMLGLKHPFDDDIHLPAATDNTDYTLMSYTSTLNMHSQFSAYDVAALAWLYGGDGLGGALGINSAGGARYVVGSGAADTLAGTAGADKLQGNGGDDSIDGGAGTDTAVFSASFGASHFSLDGDAIVVTSALDGVDTVRAVEVFQFSDGSYTRAQIFNDNTPPAAPTAAAASNASGYAAGNRPLVTGVAEAGALVKVYSGKSELGSAVAGADGHYSVTLNTLADGSYSVFSTATDHAGNVSAASASVAFKVDTVAPAVPVASVTMALPNQPVFSGSGEAGATISLFNMGNVVIGTATVSGNGSWTAAPLPLVNGSYSVTVQSADGAGNISSAAGALAFTVATALNLNGTGGNDMLKATAGNNAIDGGAGIDTAVYSGARANTTVTRTAGGYSTTAATGGDGTDMLYNVERIVFADRAVALDIDGHGGQAYRMYSVFGRAPDQAGLGYWISVLDRGLSVMEMAGYFIDSPEFVRIFSSSVTTDAFVETMYLNVLHRASEAEGKAYWIDAIEHHGLSRAQVLSYFSESQENIAALVGVVGNGFDFIPYA